MKTRNHLFGWIAASLLSVLFVACDGLQTVSEAELEEMEELSLKMAKSMLVETDSLVVDSFKFYAGYCAYRTGDRRRNGMVEKQRWESAGFV